MASQVPFLSIESLRDRQEVALIDWERGLNPAPLLEAWIDIHSAWSAADPSQQDAMLGHIAVLWQELNARCPELTVTPLLNQFVHVSFRGISAKAPRDFKPVLAADAASWLAAMSEAATALVEEITSSKEELLDALVAQYATVFARRIEKTVEQVLVDQLRALTLARRCQVSSLYLIEPVAWNVEGAPGVRELLDLLARIIALPREGKRDPASLLPNGQESVSGLRQLIGFWSVRAPFIGRFIQRHWPTLVPLYEAPPAPHVGSLPSPNGLDQHVLLVANAAATRKWLLGAEAACGSAPLHIHSVGALDLDGLRARWRAHGTIPEASAGPQLYVERTASALCRILAWEFPSSYFEHGGQRAGHTGDRNAAMFRACRETIDAQQPGAALLLFNQLELRRANAATLARPYCNAVAQVASLLEHGGGAVEGFTWCLVFDGAAAVRRLAAESIDSQLQADYENTLKGEGFSAHDPVVTVAAASAEGFLSAALAHPRCLNSPAFSQRLNEDLRALLPLLETLIEHGFGSIGVCYTDSSAAEASNWEAFNGAWKFLEQRLVRATFAARKAFLEQRFDKEISRLRPAAARKQGVFVAVAPRLNEVGELAQAGGPQRSEASLMQLWAELEKKVGRQVFTPATFAELWQGGEERQRRSQASIQSIQTCLTTIAESLLCELGIPEQPLAEFSWSSSTGTSAAESLGNEEWEALVRLTGKPLPLASGDSDLALIRPLFRGYDPLAGSLSHHCLLRDFGPDDVSRALLFEHGAKTVVRLLFDAQVSVDDKARLLLLLRGYQPGPLRHSVSLKRGERDPLKQRVLGVVWRDILTADLILVHLLRLTSETARLLVNDGSASASPWDYRRRQLLNLLDAGGFKVDSIAEDVHAANFGLARLIGLWKDFYRNRGPHRATERGKLLEVLTGEYKLWCKPSAVPSLLPGTTDVNDAVVRERSAYLAAYCLELLGRMPKAASTTGSARESSGGLAPEEYCRRAKSLLDSYITQRARYAVRAAAASLEESHWLQGFGPDYELIGRDILAGSQLDPDQQGLRISQVVTAAVRLQEEELLTETAYYERRLD